ncbi:MAG: hypothetical protein ACQEUT_18255 [Bacillota bacterium]
MNFSSFGFFTFDKGIVHQYMKLPDFSYAELSVFAYIMANVQNQDNGNNKKGYCYRTKTRICKDLKMSRSKLNKSIELLKTYKLIQHREVPNYRGGHHLEEYKPMPLLSTTAFTGEFGHLLSDYDYSQISKKK